MNNKQQPKTFENTVSIQRLHMGAPMWYITHSTESLNTSTQIISKLVRATEDEILYVKKRLSDQKALPCV